MNKFQRKISGQALITMVIFALVLFVFVGLGLDSGMLYLERRQLQNTADAACLAAATEIGLKGSSAATTTAATNAANQYIRNNLSSSAAVAFQLPANISTADFIYSGNGQSGTGLTQGIRVDGSSIRVAITLPAYTYFLRLGGIETYNVMARAHCNSTSGGGIWPVAINRFPGYEQDGVTRKGIANTGASLPQTYGNGANPPYLKVRDILQAQSVNTGIINDGPLVAGAGCSSTRRNWYDWPDLGDANDSPPTGPFRQSCAPASMPANLADANAPEAGWTVEMAGQNANPNVGNNGNSYSGPITLDARQISFPTRLFYNGQSDSNSTNAWKDLIVKYILTQYPGPPVIPGQELGVVSGISAGNILDAVRDRYKPNDVVTALVYNGQLYFDPDFQLTVTCVQGSLNCNNNGTNSGKNVFRNPVPSGITYFNATCVPSAYSGDYYIADGNDADFSVASPRPQPAQYIVRLAPVASSQGTAASTIRLTARLSGANVGSTSPNEAGAPEDFGKMLVRWKWTDAAGANQVRPTSGWQRGDVPVDVDMSVSGVNVTLEVIQSDKEEQSCPTNPLIKANVPKRVNGAQVIQVMGQSVGASGTSRWNSAYGEIGMRSSSSSPFYATKDYYLTFDGNPSGIVKNEAPQVSIEPKLTLTDANGGTIGWSSMSSAYDIVWYKEGTRLTSPPANMAAVLDHSGQDPTLKITVTPGAALLTGEYDIDLQLYGASSNQRIHSNRFHLRVETAINSSIDSWVVAICYANFQIMDLSDPNVVKGRAVSGCLRPGEVTAGLTSRLVAW